MATRRSARLYELPEGFAYSEEFLSGAEDAELVALIRDLPFEQVVFQGYAAKRRTVQFGLSYDFATRAATPTQDLPEFLIPLRDRAAAFAGLEPPLLAEAIVTEYPVGAPMGWHRDVPQFETIVGVSLGGVCWMRLRPYERAGKVLSLMLRPGSIYVMSGVARWGFQHSIVPVDELRYSITFRTMRGAPPPRMG